MIFQVVALRKLRIDTTYTATDCSRLYLKPFRLHLLKMDIFKHTSYVFFSFISKLLYCYSWLEHHMWDWGSPSQAINTSQITAFTSCYRLKYYWLQEINMDDHHTVKPTWRYKICGKTSENENTCSWRTLLAKIQIVFISVSDIPTYSCHRNSYSAVIIKVLV